MSYNLEDLLHLMSCLRDPQHGCPWDRKQDFSSIVPHTLEEAYEVADAIEREDYEHLKEELGDLLFQVIFYAQLGKEKDYFSFAQIVDQLVIKLVRRHPHVFPGGELASFGQLSELSLQEVSSNWQKIKDQEKQGETNSVLDDIPLSLPALTAAYKVQKKAAGVGFDWEEIAPVFDKIEEEVLELKEAIREGYTDRIKDELGDLLFTCVNLSRHLQQDPEGALRGATSKFKNRFRLIESIAKERKQDISSLTLDELDMLWREAKRLAH